MKQRASKLWNDITASLFANVDETFVSSFRAPGGANRRLAAWDPFDRSMRYYKFMLFNLARSKPDAFFKAYRRLGDTSTGLPVTVRVRDCDIDIDYLFAVEEWLFLSQHVDFAAVNSVVEIGAGFGRTCHALMQLSDSIDVYTIVDLPEILNLSQAYLARVLSARIDRVRFISCDDTAAWQGISADLAVNIDSFQEMPPVVVDDYMAGIVAHARYFYCKNPMGKYSPKDIGLENISADQLSDVYSLGYCRQKLGLFDEASLAVAREEYVVAYRPKQPGWRLLADQPLELFPYVQHALFER